MPHLAAMPPPERFNVAAHDRPGAEVKTRLPEIAECRHSPHRDQPAVLMRRAADRMLRPRTPQSFINRFN